MNIFKQFIKSFYSPKDIAMFRFQGIGKTILYVFFLVLLSIIPSVYYFGSALINGVNAVEESVKNELPPFQIKNGVLQAEQDAPIIINKEDFTIIFDSTGTVDSEKLANSDNTLAILKNDAYFIAGGQVQSLPYSMFPDLSLTNESLLELLDTADSSLPIFIPLLAVVIFIFASGMKFIEISILALFGQFMNKMMLKNLHYRQSWRLAAYSVTLPTMFFTIMNSLQTVVPNAAIINWFVAIMILFLAIKEIPQPKKK
ncbi:DUF1189 domain-containing protein [Cytobacillus dafuensis]|uniref:DUF1189 domain-containing protein n=1 Tax=Cytobacillus dafuensis TaxID=1742359 RepID=A0A5B8Z6Z1_CYTDA|nr:DUF1189 domain-containing protein [Cytobacillus dafuensis]QED48651.1 DUF1189 domain-containing protein [Cytobacillus dafuensis]